jgi:hypothetical protein
MAEALQPLTPEPRESRREATIPRLTELPPDSQNGATVSAEYRVDFQET